MSCLLLSNVIPEIRTLHAPIIAAWFRTPMHPTGESSVVVVQMLLDFLSSPSVRLGVVKSFVAWHVRLTCQMLTTNVASCKRVSSWPQGLSMPSICERQSTLPVETATLTVALPSFPGNIRNICNYPETKSNGGQKYPQS
jgi:hypothetical protein